MKTKFKSVFTGLFYGLSIVCFVALGVYNLYLTNNMRSYMAVLTFSVGVISLGIGIVLAYLNGLSLLDKLFHKDDTEENEYDEEEYEYDEEEDENDGEEQ